MSFHPKHAFMNSVLPDSNLGKFIQCVYFVNSGSEANDMAMMLARAHTGNWDLVSLRNGYHGMSMATMGACGHSTWKQPVPQVCSSTHYISLSSHSLSTAPQRRLMAFPCFRRALASCMR